MTQFHYTVPLVGEDLSAKETILQFCDSLAHLNRVVDDVFSRIEARVLDSHSSIKEINKRIDVTQTKIDTIRGSTKALKVFSSAKYPGDIKDNIYSDYISIYKDVNIEMNDDSHINQLPIVQISPEEMFKEKTRFYTVPALVEDNDLEYEEGLGSLPDNIETLGSLLLFNTSENIYNDYCYLDPLGVVVRTRVSETGQVLAAAPTTITNREDFNSTGKTENYMFIPDIGEVPTIDAPDILPDLIGIAVGVEYKINSETSIAPSSSSFPPPPPTDIKTVLELPTTPSNDNVVVEEHPPPPQEDVIAVTLPPPPPPPPPAFDVNLQQDIKKEEQPEKKKKKKPQNKSLEDGRSDLLASIRKAGGSKGGQLAKSKQRKPREMANAKPETSLMDDLAAKLTLRRKGISGEKRTEPLCRLSSMIPEPPLCEVEERPDSPDWD